MATLPLSQRQSSIARRILLAGAIVALLDIAYAYVYFALILGLVDGFAGVLQSIAAGLLGRAAFEGGMGTAALGAVLHVIIAYAWTCAFFVAVRAWEGLRRAMRTQTGAVIVGLVFGMLVWVVMDLVVMELSRARSLPPTHPRFWINLAQHAVMVGLPIALIVRDGE
jgi:Na+-translocating ferredoxin:NAD+ oxidoreductase RnfD subunit